MATSASIPPQDELRNTFEQRARQALSRPWTCQPAFPARALALLRVWHFPAFALHRSWTLFAGLQAPPTEAFIVRRVEWDREADLERFAELLTLPQRARLHQSSGPMLTVTDGEVSAREWSSLMDEAPLLHLPVGLPSERFMSTDGERFGIERPMLALSLNLEWSNEPPEIWKDLGTWAARVRKLLDAAVVGDKKR